MIAVDNTYNNSVKPGRLSENGAYQIEVRDIMSAHRLSIKI